MIAEVQQILARSMGLDTASIGEAAIARAVRQRRLALGLDDTAIYADHLRDSAEELQELIEEVVVPETWFFRDREAFAALARFAVRDWLTSPATRRILSLPCSTGEEPYSMAMTLLDAGLPPALFAIDAIDISARALERGERAHFGKNSFRGEELGFRDRHFDVTPKGWQLHDNVRERVHFRHGNLFDEQRLPGTGVYDVVFCRNVLIYFDRPAQDHAVGVLKRLLKPLGYFFVGPSETALAADHGFTSTRVPMAFAFQLRPATPALPPASPPKSPPRAPVSPAVKAKTHRPPPASAAPRPSAPPAAPAPDLDEAARLADRGQLAQAAAAAEAWLRVHGASAQAYYLLGLVRDAGSDATGAIAYYRKALYLDPAHQEAMAHLALLLENAGDTHAAQALRARARRLQVKS